MLCFNKVLVKPYTVAAAHTVCASLTVYFKLYRKPLINRCLEIWKESNWKISSYALPEAAIVQIMALSLILSFSPFFFSFLFFLLAGEYSCLSVDLVFKRQFSYYLITIYVPGCMLVIVSWVSFWLDPFAVPARVSLGVTTLLTMSTQTASINNSLPPVAYTKAIDVWQARILKKKD